jgi:hypothetical protein
MELALWVVVPSLILSLGIGLCHIRWQRHTERDRFILAMMEASTPDRMLPNEKARLKLLRSPWWAFWRWVPDLWSEVRS